MPGPEPATAALKRRWSAEDIPDLTGRVAVVTGASGGIGYQIALRLAEHGAHVVLASRDRDRTNLAAQRIRAAAPGCHVEAHVLDLASLDAIHSFAGEFRRHHDGLDILINNAGVAGGGRRETADGFEIHLGINHLGPFALTGLLLPALVSRPGARVVTMSSGLAAQSRIDLDDLHSQRRYRMTTAYGQSKLANLLFAIELDRRARAGGTDLSSLAAHPGVARTNLLVGKDAEWGRGRRGPELAVRLVQILFAQPPAKAALPALYQATDPAADGRYYLGTKRHLRGYPARTPFPATALDQDTALRVWHVSEELTGVKYALAVRPTQTPR
jgi:NAD(P)-dependent dehydrogenase (short-subunit alcohol dehydrogenase family)